MIDDGTTGLLVPTHDAAALAGAIVTLLNDRARRDRMGAAGLARVRERFTMERMVRETAQLYERLLKESSAISRKQ
jgi:glycosyltransferase involved in cell wall biosynthesis